MLVFRKLLSGGWLWTWKIRNFLKNQFGPDYWNSQKQFWPKIWRHLNLVPNIQWSSVTSKKNWYTTSPTLLWKF